MASKPLIGAALAAAFNDVMERGRIALFSAPCGFGKSVVSHALLREQRVRELSADAADFALPENDGTWDVLVLDQLQNLPEEQRDSLCQLLRTVAERRFVLLSRGCLPGWLSPFQFSGLLRVFTAADLALDRTGTAELLAQYGVTLSDTELTAVARDSCGHPLALDMLGRCMADRREGYTPAVERQVRRQMMSYFEDAVYRRFDLSLRRFLLELSPFEPFDLELARIVSGDNRSGELLAYLQRQTSMLLYNGEKCRFWPVFRQFLLWELEREYTDEQRRSLYNRGALYYELHQDFGQALAFYDRGGERRKVSELLRRSAELHPGMGHYEELAAYYDTLSDEEIAASPSLMQATSMLRALQGDYAGSQRWSTRWRPSPSGAGAATRQPARRGDGWHGWTFPCPSGRDGPDGGDPRRVPADDRTADHTARLLRYQCAAQHHERRQGLLRLEPPGRPAVYHHPPGGGSGAGPGRRGSGGRRHRREQV